MKTCLLCGTKAPSDAQTCEACGEATWASVEGPSTDPDPSPAPSPTVADPAPQDAEPTEIAVDSAKPKAKRTAAR